MRLSDDHKATSRCTRAEEAVATTMSKCDQGVSHSLWRRIGAHPEAEGAKGISTGRNVVALTNMATCGRQNNTFAYQSPSIVAIATGPDAKVNPVRRAKVVNRTSLVRQVD